MAERTFRLEVARDGESAGGHPRFRAELREICDDGETRSLASTADSTGHFHVPTRRIRTALRLRRRIPSGSAREQLLLSHAGDLLFAALPAPVRSALQLAAATDEVTRLILRAPPEVAALPWEALGVPTPGDGRAPPRQPFLRGQWELLRQFPDSIDPSLGTDAEPPAPPREIRYLLVLGSARQGPRALHSATALAHLVTEVRAALPNARIVAGNDPVFEGIEVDGPVRHSEDVCREIRNYRPTVLHYVGHAVHDHTPPDPDGGARALRIDSDGMEPDLTAAQLTAATCDAGTAAVLIQACNVRDTFAGELLAAVDGVATPVEHVITTGAIVAPQRVAPWAAVFLKALQRYAAIGPAIREAHQAFVADPTYLGYVTATATWSRRSDDLVFADANALRIEDYCRRLILQLDRFQGRFVASWPGYRPSEVHVDLSVDARQADRPVHLDPRDEQRLREQDHRFDALLGFQDNRHIHLGGTPGSGKSTTLRMTARRLAGDRRRRHVPVFVALARWVKSGAGWNAEDRLLRHAVVEAGMPADAQEPLCAALTEAATAGRVALLLDGHDEVPPHDRDAFVSAMQSLRASRATCPILVSTRRYGTTRGLVGFLPFDLRPLDPDTATRLLTKTLRCSDRSRDRAEAIAARWRDVFTNGGRLWRELCEVPLFVTLLGRLLGQKPDRPPATNRPAFFDELFVHLCTDGHNDPHGPEQDRALVTRAAGDTRDVELLVAPILDDLAAIALAMTRDFVIDWPYERVRELLIDRGRDDTRDYLDRISTRSGIFGPRNGGDPEGDWGFWHRSFQEALAGWELTRRVEVEGAGAERVFADVDLMPTTPEIARERAALLVKWPVDEFSQLTGDYWPDHMEAQTRATAEQWSQIVQHLDSKGWDCEVRTPVADVLARHRAAEGRRDFWHEPVAMTLGALTGERSILRKLARRGSTADPARVIDLATALEGRDRDAARNSIVQMHPCPVELWRRAVDWTSPDAARVAAATDQFELYKLWTSRVQQLSLVYAKAGPSVAAADPAAFAAALQERAAQSDDAGEMLMILEQLNRLSAVDGHADRLRAFWSRFGEPRLDDCRGHFLMLPGGAYVRGQDGTDNEVCERPAHRVRLSPFGLGRHPVTVAMYRSFWKHHRMVIGGPIHRLEEWSGLIPGSDEPVDALPVTYVSWFAARMFCRWLAHHWEILTADMPALTGWCPELPTEAHQEYAIRGGSTTEWIGKGDGSDLAEFAWFDLQGPDGRPYAVMRKRANDFGLFDVVGNVWEWSLDAYGPYPTDGMELVDPCAGAVANRAELRVVRGGSFVLWAQLCRSAVRGRCQPADADRNLGFRVALVSSAGAPQPGSVLR